MIAIVSHDSGGAEILSSWLCHHQVPCCLVLDGPALHIFKRKLGAFEIHSLERAIELSDWVLCGSSWQSDLEKQAISQAKVAGKKIIVFLDHWTNYLDRFQLNGVTIFPDEIWVGDVNAKKIAQNIFPDINVVLQPNLYFKDILDDLSGAQNRPHNPKKCCVLYVCEPIREHALLQYGDERYWGYTEEDALEFFFHNLGALGEIISEIKIRPHPSEIDGKYYWAKQKSSLVTETEGNKSLVEQIMEADVVVGCESMAMVIGLLAKKRVISSIPMGGKTCSLPHAEIEHLQALVKKNQEILNA
tara:strand:+ start:17903 stop:18808 length:906 start_codon:yes stop_codon:yes gene_type:complete